jgi:hypothetical protein
MEDFTVGVWLGAVVFHGIIPYTCVGMLLTCTAYHWGTFIEADKLIHVKVLKVCSIV